MEISINEYLKGLETQRDEFQKTLPNKHGSWWNPYDDKIRTFKNLDIESQFEIVKYSIANTIKALIEKTIYHPVFTKEEIKEIQLKNPVKNISGPDTCLFLWQEARSNKNYELADEIKKKGRELSWKLSYDSKIKKYVATYIKDKNIF